MIKWIRTGRYVATGFPEIDRLEVQLREIKSETRAATEKTFQVLTRNPNPETRILKPETRNPNPET